MIYNYNRLWKLLIDKGMTKTQMRKAAGISTNILAKMGKGEPVAMDSLAKIATALQCGLDDIVEIQGVVDGVASHVGRLEQRGDRAVVVVLQIVGVGLCEGRKLHRLVVRVGDVDVEVIAEDERLGAVSQLDVAAHGRAVRALHHTVVIAVRQTDAVDH